MRTDVCAFRLASGQLTGDRSAWLADLHAGDARSAELNAAASAVLRHPIEPARSSPTPARAAAVRMLSADGLLPAAVADHVVSLGGVTDGIWAELRVLTDLIEAATVSIFCWEIVITPETAADIAIDVYNPLEHQSDRPPLVALKVVLAELTLLGWTQTGRAVRSYDYDEDLGDGDRWITAIRYPLVRCARDEQAEGATEALDVSPASNECATP